MNNSILRAKFTLNAFLFLKIDIVSHCNINQVDRMVVHDVRA